MEMNLHDSFARLVDRLVEAEPILHNLICVETVICFLAGFIYAFARETH